jgi:hypothetical protein
MTASPEKIIDPLAVVTEFRPQAQHRAVTATPFKWIEPESIPTRRFLFASRHAVAGHVTVTGALGGAGKSSLEVVDLLAHATGRNLLNDAPLFQGRSWYLGLEDPLEEHGRRVAATALLHGISPAEFKGRFFLDDASQDFVIARDSGKGLTIAEPVVTAIIEEIRAHGITFLAVDPFVACHSVAENDNGAIDTVARLWVRIARETGCAIDLVHHLRKGNGGEPSADDFRGASALLPAVRAARLLVTMTKEEGERRGIPDHLRFFRVVDAKRNMAARSAEHCWHQLTAIDLRNGNGGPSDHVAAVEAWRLPDASTLANAEQLEAIKSAISGGVWRADFRANDWIGNAIAQVMDLDLRDQAVRKSIAGAVKAWIDSGELCIRERKDPKSRKEFAFVEVAR